MASPNKAKQTRRPEAKERRSPQSESQSLGELRDQLRGYFSRNLANHRLQVASSVTCGLGLLYILAALFFYLISGSADQSVLDPGLTAEQVDELRGQLQNPLGMQGVYIGNYLFNELFGVGIFAFFIFCFRVLIGNVTTPTIRFFDALTSFLFWGFCMLWSSLMAATLQYLWPTDTFLLYGGAWGMKTVQVLLLHIGGLGLSLLLFGTLLLVAILNSDRVLETMQHPPLRKPELSVPRLKRPNILVRWGRKFWSFVKATEPADEVEDEGDIQQAASTAEPAEAAVAAQPTAQAATAAVDAAPAPAAHPAPRPALSYQQPETTYVEEAAVAIDLETEAQRFLQTQPQQSLATEGGMIVEQAPADDLVEDLAPEREPLAPGIQLVHYQKPTIDLLRDYEQNATGIDMEEIEHNKQQIIDTLASFKLPVTPCKATVGPTVTLYEVIPDSGIKVSRIKSMDDDIAMGLKSEGIRIIAPMPGQGTVGIEVPNSNPQTVSMRSILASRKYREQQEKMELPIGIGKTITNEPFIFDLAKMPHLLIAGATGQGKSVGLNALITSLLYSKRPEELKFVMVDPKMLEFSVYEEIEHQFLAKLPDSDKAIITDMSRVVATLNSLCVEMDNRYRKLQTAGRAVRNIREYNEQVRSGELRRLDGHELMPYIVLIVDEFADLMMTVGKEVEQPIARLAQKARAAGIHMVIATQRPSTDVITGLIKANFPARIAFKVFSMVDSRTVLDSPGANQLIGRGDMLFYQGKDMIRVQCAFMDTPETELIVEHIASQESLGYAYELPEYVPEGGEGAKDKSFSSQEKDSLFDEVALLVVQMQVGSTSYIQRKFNIGYNRAGRLMDQLEGAGIVGPQEGSKPREVYIKDQMSLEHLLQQLG